ncbi:hypothetical protein LRC537489_29890 [Mycobacterium riyadhense]
MLVGANAATFAALIEEPIAAAFAAAVVNMSGVATRYDIVVLSPREFFTIGRCDDAQIARFGHLSAAVYRGIWLSLDLLPTLPRRSRTMEVTEGISGSVLSTATSVVLQSLWGA